jgi:hypothetical protein
MNKNKTNDEKNETSATNVADSSLNTNYIVLNDSIVEPDSSKLHESEVEVIKEAACCPLCFKIVDSSLENHFALEHKEFDCPFCGSIFDTDEQLNSHVTAAHSDTTDKTETKIIEADEASESLECPVCSCKAKDREWLEIHVDSHFNPTHQPESDMTKFENQFADVPRTSRSAENSTFNLSEDMDYQLALSVQEEERKRSSDSKSSTSKSILKNQDPIKAQLEERRKNEALKFKLSKGTIFHL